MDKSERELRKEYIMGQYLAKMQELQLLSERMASLCRQLANIIQEDRDLHEPHEAKGR